MFQKKDSRHSRIRTIQNLDILTGGVI